MPLNSRTHKIINSICLEKNDLLFLIPNIHAHDIPQTIIFLEKKTKTYACYLFINIKWNTIFQV